VSIATWLHRVMLNVLRNGSSRWQQTVVGDTTRTTANVIRIDYKDEVIFLLGKDEKRFVTHVDLVKEASGFIRDSLKGCWKEGEEKTIRLPEQSAVAFNIYLDFCYRQVIDLRRSGEEKGWQGATYKKERFQRLVKSYVLGDMLRDDVFCNALIDAWFDLRSQEEITMEVETINTIFDRLPERSKLRLLVAHEAAYGISKDAFKEALPYCHPQLCKLIAETAVLEDHLPREKKKPEARPRCMYHLHPEESKSTIKVDETAM
jgi:hypothetical protein